MNDMRVTVEAPAKINLMLDILGRLDNGYHTLWMIMQSVSLCDFVTLERTQEKEIVIRCSEKGLPSDHTNIAYKAAVRFFEAAGIENPGLIIQIEKHIPFAAGLAGGSADAAAVLLGLNELFETNLPMKQLCRIGFQVGADVPFCLRGGTMLAQDMGELLSDLPDLPRCYLVLAKPEQEVSTAEAYHAADTAQNRRPPDKDRMLRALLDEDLDTVCASLGNVFEQFIDVPQRVDIKRIIRESGGKGCCMSGSGPTVFGIFEQAEQAEACARKLREKIPAVFVCTPRADGCRVFSREP